MAMIRRNDRTQAPARGEWDPFQVMQEIMRWEPFRQMGVAPSLATEERSFIPKFEVKENKEGYVFKADLPGVKESDLDISLTGNLLTVSGRRESEQRDEGETYYAYERSYGSFSRSFALPESADGEHVRAELKDGVLTLVLPKKPEMQPRKISVSAPAAKDAPKH